MNAIMFKKIKTELDRRWVKSVTARDEARAKRKNPMTRSHNGSNSTIDMLSLSIERRMLIILTQV